ncbi:formate dehydrogenase beta subunit [Candidatus Methylacidithermus pantelleriae]|uniref:Formate dehydrogenase beta subunit n=1 Tax=Candidatus Methylacidithermus pantelleriae TaxID=2744239 RepID=A0A8J2BUC5_9BACT|nr:Formate dehydrogenase beta subunit [Candidatus Methylacidithermus pantelleriae]
MKRVFVPRDTTAVAMGADEVAATLVREAERRGEEICVVRNGSWGLLWLEPLVEVEVGEKRIAYGPVAVEDIPGLWEAGFLEGKNHPLCRGVTEEISYLKKQERLTFARVGRIDPLSWSDYLAHGGLRGLNKALEMAPEEIVREVSDSGLRGRGGAAFPTGIKWKTVLSTPADQKYIVCNADEGDSGSFSDRMLMEGDPLTLIEGMVIAGLAVGATQGYIYLRSEYPIAKEVLEQAIALAYERGCLGRDILGSGRSFDLELRIGAGAYICGEETSLLESLEGKRGLVRYKPPVPAVKGLFGRPTVVNNVITLASVPVILDRGASFYRDFGMGRSRGTIPLQLGGNVRQGGLVEKAFGITLQELVHDFGGGTWTGRPVKTAQVGGPLGAYIPAWKFDLPLDYEALSAAGALLGHGGVVVFDDSVNMAKMARYAFEFCALESCGKCTPCRIGSVRGKEVMERIIQNENPEANLRLIKDLCEVMKLASLCAMGGLTPYPVLSALEWFPEDFGLNPKKGERIGWRN